MGSTLYYGDALSKFVALPLNIRYKYIICFNLVLDDWSCKDLCQVYYLLSDVESKLGILGLIWVL